MSVVLKCMMVLYRIRSIPIYIHVDLPNCLSMKSIACHHKLTTIARIEGLRQLYLDGWCLSIFYMHISGASLEVSIYSANCACSRSTAHSLVP